MHDHCHHNSYQNWTIGPAIRARPSPVYGACQMKGVLLNQYSNCPLLFTMQKQRKYQAKSEAKIFSGIEGPQNPNTWQEVRAQLMRVSWPRPTDRRMIGHSRDGNEEPGTILDAAAPFLPSFAIPPSPPSPDLFPPPIIT